ncbi:J domain-containing protein [Halomonas getboli]|uniref:J domain-containing protein n=1 Tax=Halomonas getboli TaxID=2935862 RepID=UPI001FFE9FE8|nr:J domain-containing protein [Halomonas getboli]MCK2183805.1 DnaJ domain-containing protein [Halomonas getboli]
MTAARFSTFELLLLQSRDQADSAALLLLAWVLTQQGPVGEAERAQLVSLTGAFRHGHALEPLLEIAASQDLGAIQLAAEVLQKELHGDTARAFLRLAVTLAAEHGEPTLANHHVLRFLADLLGVSPPEFAELYASQVGRALREPGDPSRQDYWQRREQRARDRRRETAGEEKRQQYTQEQADKRDRAETESPRATRTEARRQAREERAEAKRQRQQEKEQAKARQQAERDAEKRRQQARREAEKQRQRAEREQARRRREDERAQRRGGHREQRRDDESAHRAHERPAAPDPRIRSALTVLGLEPGASRGEIRKAYRRLAQAHHPDRFHQEGEAIVASASRRFQRIRRAYDFLMKVS